MSTAQVESVLVEHKNVAESAVVAAPHKVKGECLYCFVTPKDGCRVGIILYVNGEGAIFKATFGPLTSKSLHFLDR